MAESSSSRPRRSIRAPAKGPETIVRVDSSSSPTKKRKTRDPDARINHLLTNAKSELTTMDISDIINYDNFLNLSADSQELLCTMLPPTAFFTYQQTVDPTHPARAGVASTPEDNFAERSPATLDPMFFTSSFLISAAHTFQDQIFSGWMGTKAKEAIAKYETGVQDGSLHAEWKDEEWLRDHPPPKRTGGLQTADLDIVELVRRSLLREGDVLAYRRQFPTLGMTVRKDLIVQNINKQSYAVTLLLAPGTSSALPQDLLITSPAPPKPPILTMEDIMSSLELEDAILDVDGQLPRSERHVLSLSSSPNARPPAEGTLTANLRANRAAKAISIWRWREEVASDLELQMSLEKGGRDLIGTAFYLRRT